MAGGYRDYRSRGRDRDASDSSGDDKRNRATGSRDGYQESRRYGTSGRSHRERSRDRGYNRPADRENRGGENGASRAPREDMDYYRPVSKPSRFSDAP